MEYEPIGVSFISITPDFLLVAYAVLSSLEPWFEAAAEEIHSDEQRRGNDQLTSYVGPQQFDRGAPTGMERAGPPLSPIHTTVASGTTARRFQTVGRTR